MQGENPFQLEVVSVRLNRENPFFSDHKITTPEDAVEVIGKVLCEMDREVICVMNLKTDGTPINCHMASVGAIDQAIAHPRELFKASILSNASQIIMVHCHPSGCLEPSKADTMMTDQMIKLTELMGIPLVDHIIVGGDNSKYFSFREKKILKNPTIRLHSDYKMLDFDNKSIVAEQGKVR